MTDAEIIKALECCTSDKSIYCEDQCPFYERCNKYENLSKYALDLINRQKAKIEELSEVLSDTIRIRYAEIKAEAIKEFAERLKGSKGKISMLIFPREGTFDYIPLENIDNLVKEMVGDT